MNKPAAQFHPATIAPFVTAQLYNIFIAKYSLLARQKGATMRKIGFCGSAPLQHYNMLFFKRIRMLKNNYYVQASSNVVDVYLVLKNFVVLIRIHVK